MFDVWIRVCVCTVWSIHHFAYTCLLSFNWGVRFLSSVLSIPFDPVSCTLFHAFVHISLRLPSTYSRIKDTCTQTHNGENMPRMFVTENRTKLESSNQVEFFLITVLSLSLSLSYEHMRIACMWHSFLLSNFTGIVYFSYIYLFLLFRCFYFFSFFCVYLTIFSLFIWIQKPKDLKDDRIKNGPYTFGYISRISSKQQMIHFFNYFMHHS